MSTGFGGESVSAAGLPVTGSGPFTLLVGIVGVGAVGVGALLRGIGRADPVEPALAVPGVGARSLGAAAASDDAIMAEAIAWLDQQLDAEVWVDQQLRTAVNLERQS